MHVTAACDLENATFFFLIYLANYDHHSPGHWSNILEGRYIIGIRMQNRQMTICEEISGPPVCPTDCNLAASLSPQNRHVLHGGRGVDFRSLLWPPA